MKNQNYGAIALTALLLTTTLSACTVPSQAGTDATPEASTGQAATTTGGMFTDRDREIGYEESECVAIALSDGASTSTGMGVEISGDTVTITAEGSYLLTGTLSDGQVVVNVTNTQKVQLILNGVSLSNSSTAPLYVVEADKVFVTLAADTENTLSVTGEFVPVDDNNVDAALFSKGDLTLNGNGTLTVTNPYGNGITTKDDLVVTSGSYTVTAANHAIEGKDSVRIASGTFHLTAGGDGLHSNNAEDADRGFVYIDGGSFEITSGDDGIHAETAVTINGGTLQIPQSYEGIEGHTITVTGGEIHIKSSDDGLNAAGGADSSGTDGRQTPGAFAVDNAAAITIEGGSLFINAEGDGIDSNGALTVTGGEVYVSGPSITGNSALDYSGSANITGGIVVAVGAGGMAQNFGQDSTQASMLVTAQGVCSGDVVVTDANGNELVRFTPDKSYQSALVSLPALTVGESYTVTLGDESQTITLTELLYGSGGMGGMGGEHPGGMGGGRPDGTGGERPGGLTGGEGTPPPRPTSNQAPPSAG